MRNETNTCVDFQPLNTVKNFANLAQKLSLEKFLTDSILVSFDACSMYSNIPVAFSLQIMLDHLRKNLVLDEVIQDFFKLISVFSKFIIPPFPSLELIFSGDALSISFWPLDVRTFTVFTINSVNEA